MNECRLLLNCILDVSRFFIVVDELADVLDFLSFHDRRQTPIEIIRRYKQIVA